MPLYYVRAALMGVKIPDDDFSTIDVLRELEHSRNLLNDKNNNAKKTNITINDGLGNDIPLSLTWDDENRDEEEPFILVQSKQRKKREKRRRSGVIVSPIRSARPMTRSQKEVGEGTTAMDPGRPPRAKNKLGRYK